MATFYNNGTPTQPVNTVISGPAAGGGSVSVRSARTSDVPTGSVVSETTDVGRIYSGLPIANNFSTGIFADKATYFNDVNTNYKYNTSPLINTNIQLDNYSFCDNRVKDPDIQPITGGAPYIIDEGRLVDNLYDPVITPPSSEEYLPPIIGGVGTDTGSATPGTPSAPTPPSYRSRLDPPETEFFYTAQVRKLDPNTTLYDYYGYGDAKDKNDPNPKLVVATSKWLDLGTYVRDLQLDPTDVNFPGQEHDEVLYGNAWYCFDLKTYKPRGSNFQTPDPNDPTSYPGISLYDKYICVSGENGQWKQPHILFPVNFPPDTYGMSDPGQQMMNYATIVGGPYPDHTYCSGACSPSGVNPDGTAQDHLYGYAGWLPLLADGIYEVERITNDVGPKKARVKGGSTGFPTYSPGHDTPLLPWSMPEKKPTNHPGYEKLLIGIEDGIVKWRRYITEPAPGSRARLSWAYGKYSYENWPLANEGNCYATYLPDHTLITEIAASYFGRRVYTQEEADYLALNPPVSGVDYTHPAISTIYTLTGWRDNPSNDTDPNNFDDFLAANNACKIRDGLMATKKQVATFQKVSGSVHYAQDLCSKHLPQNWQVNYDPSDSASPLVWKSCEDKLFGSIELCRQWVAGNGGTKLPPQYYVPPMVAGMVMPPEGFIPDPRVHLPSGIEPWCVDQLGGRKIP